MNKQKLLKNLQTYVCFFTPTALIFNVKFYKAIKNLNMHQYLYAAILSIQRKSKL